MGILDDVTGSISAAWDAASSKVAAATAPIFGRSVVSGEAAQAMAKVNRLVSVLIGMRASAAYKAADPAYRKAYANLYRAVRDLLNGLSDADPKFQIKVPSDIGMNGIRGVIELPREQWRAQTRTVDATTPLNGLGRSLGQLGAVPLIPILVVVALAVVSAGAGAVTYFATAEGRARMSIAEDAANRASAVAKAVSEGKLSSATAVKLLEAGAKAITEATPDSSGGMGIGGWAGLGIAALLGTLIVANKLSRAF